MTETRCRPRPAGAAGDRAPGAQPDPHRAGAQGSLRAADIARELDIPANQASFHLRQLAKYGLVEEDPAAARDKRDRVWRAVDPGGLTINLKELEESPGGKAASAVYLRNAAAWGQVVIDSALNRRDPETHSSLTEMAVRLTKEEATRLTGELNEVVERWAASNRGGHDDGPSHLPLLRRWCCPIPSRPRPTREHASLLAERLPRLRARRRRARRRVLERGHRVRRVRAARGGGEFATLVPPDGAAYLRVQRLGRRTRPDPPGPARRRTRLLPPTRRGPSAPRAGPVRDGHVVLASPGGFTFCFVSHPGGRVPPPPPGPV